LNSDTLNINKVIKYINWENFHSQSISEPKIKLWTQLVQLTQRKKKNDRNTTLLQQVYNSSLTRGGSHTLWSPPHVRWLLYTCCKSVVRESLLPKETYEDPVNHQGLKDPLQNLMNILSY
jgi:hypothetical protein